MLKRLELNKPFRVKAIRFLGSITAEYDRIVFFAGNFLIVAKDIEDTAPTWYSIEVVAVLEGVTPLDTPNQQGRLVFI